MMKKAESSDDELVVHQNDYQIAIVCALPLEADAVERSLDDTFESDATVLQRAKEDRNSYTTGRIGPHNVVLVHMPGTGKINATAVALGVISTFPNIALALVVGVCGGAPETPDGQQIYLGDVIISTQVIQGDFGRELPNSFVVKNTQEGNLGQAPPAIKSFLNKLQGPNGRLRLQKHATDYTDTLLSEQTRGWISSQQDILFPAHFLHKHHETDGQTCTICLASEDGVCPRSAKLNCKDLGCLSVGTGRSRNEASKNGPAVYFGAVSSTDTVKRSGVSREAFAKEHKVIGFEMEGAGVWEFLPTIVIKGVCDYADSHKNKEWQEYAAITAAATCKGLLQQWLGRAAVVARRAHPSTLGVNPMDLKRDAYLASLEFSEIESRFHNIKFAYPHTCDWILHTEQFKKWLSTADEDAHHGVLWIKGKPGSGKSTLMKHILQFCQQDKNLVRSNILAFFFNASGTDNQRSQLGLLRFITYQLLSKNPTALDYFINTFPVTSVVPIEQRQWTLEQLRHFLSYCAQRGWIIDTVILIDAVDECNSTEIRMLVDFCEDLVAATASGGSALRICFSIRNFPDVSTQNCLEIHIDDTEAHAEAIGKYLTAKLRVEDTGIHSLVLEKANHVFLWVVLVVQMLNDEYYKGSGVETLKQHLKQVPPDLESIFATLLGPAARLDPQTVSMLRLVLYAFEPLNPFTLHALTMVGTGSLKGRKQSKEKLTVPTLQRFVNHFSRGLLEISWKGEALTEQLQENTAQFIHESVADYLRAASGNPKLDKTPQTWNESSCHAHLAQICLNSIKLDDPPMTKELLAEQPYIVYSLTYLLSHIGGVVEKSTICELLSSYIDAIESWSWYYRSGWPGHVEGDLALCSVIFPKDPAIKHNGVQENILRHMIQALQARKNVTSGTSKFGDALYAAVQENWLEGVIILLECGADIGATNSRYADILVPVYQAITRFRSDNARVEANVMILEVLLAAKIRAGRPVNSVATLDVSPLTEAISQKQENIITLLLAAGADINVNDDKLGTPLIAAVRIGDIELCGRLLRLGADPNAGHDLFGHALIQAVRSEKLELVKMLLDRGADVNMNYTGQDQALASSAARGLVDITTLLLERGADVNSSGGPQGAALVTALTYGHADIARILLIRGADSKSRNAREETALVLAVKAGYTNIVRALLPDSDFAESSFVLPGYNAAAQHVAVLMCRTDILLSITTLGLDFELADQDGNTVIDLAATRGDKHDERIRSIFEDRYGDLNEYNETVNPQSRGRVMDILKQAMAQRYDGGPKVPKRNLSA